jgi:hypothetical protein
VCAAGHVAAELEQVAEVSEAHGLAGVVADAAQGGPGELGVQHALGVALLVDADDAHELGEGPRDDLVVAALLAEHHGLAQLALSHA